MLNPPIPECPEPEERLLLGNVTKVRGLRGDLKVIPLTWDLNRLESFSGIWWSSENAEPKYLAIKRFRVSGGVWYLKFSDYPTRELAQELVGGILFIHQSDRAPLQEDHFYFDDMIGCRVVCSRYGDIGNVTEVIETTSCEMIKVMNDDREILIPCVKEFINSIDSESKTIQVDLPEGFIEQG